MLHMGSRLRGTKKEGSQTRTLHKHTHTHAHTHANMHTCTHTHTCTCTLTKRANLPDSHTISPASRKQRERKQARSLWQLACIQPHPTPIGTCSTSWKLRYQLPLKQHSAQQYLLFEQILSGVHTVRDALMHSRYCSCFIQYRCKHSVSQW